MDSQQRFVSLDLVPVHWHRRDRSRRHAITIVCVGVLLCTVASVYGYMVGRRAELVSQKLDQVHELTVDVRRARGINQLMQQRIDEAQAATQRLDAFSNTRAWRQLMLRTAELTDDTLVLTRVSCLRNRSGSRRSSKSLQNDEAVAPRQSTIDVEGVAADQESLNRFINGLDTTGAFTSVQLMWTRRQRADQVDGFAFALKCDWEESS